MNADPEQRWYTIYNAFESAATAQIMLMPILRDELALPYLAHHKRF